MCIRDREYSETLNGTNGRSYKYLNEDLEQSTNVRQPTDGHTVVSTIDATLQGIVEKYIDKFITDYTNKNVEGPAAKNIGVVMMNPQNGEILAMATDVDVYKRQENHMPMLVFGLEGEDSIVNAVKGRSAGTKITV